jgi:hypothetical protein
MARGLSSRAAQQDQRLGSRFLPLPLRRFLLPQLLALVPAHLSTTR